MSTDKAADPLVEGPAVAVSRFAPQTGGGCDSSRIANLLPSAQLSAPPVCSSPVTSTCVLRSFRREDMSAVLSMGTNPRVCKWLKYARFPQPYSERDARVWLEEAAIPSIDSATPPLYLAIADPTTDVCLGCIALEPKKDIEHHTLEIAYWLDEPHWGRKVVSHAIGGIIKLGMERFSYVQRIEAGILSSNSASGKALLNNGFVLEGCMRRAYEKDGLYYDKIMYALVREELVPAPGEGGWESEATTGAAATGRIE